MISLLRVDDRLIHGQVAVTWTSYLSANTIVVANNKVANDDFMKMALLLAKPPGVDVHMLSLDDAITFCNDSGNDSKKIFVVVESTDDALVLCQSIAGVKDVVHGGIRKSDGKVRIDRQVFLSQKDIENSLEIEKLGKQVHVQVVPSERKIALKEAISIFQKGK